MVLAYLRNPDLIKPDYKLGVKSRFREQLVLRAEDLHAYAAGQEVRLDSLRAVLNIVEDGSDRKEILDMAAEAGSMMLFALNLDSMAIKTENREARRSKMKAAYDVLSSRGLVGVARKDFTESDILEIMRVLKKRQKEQNRAEAQAEE